MIGTYASAALICAASLLVGRAILSLSGRDSWSWLEPAVGFGAVLTVTGLLARAPGHGTAAALGLSWRCWSSRRWSASAARTRRRALLREGLPVAVILAIALSIPFAVSGRWGLLGVGFNNDLGLHLAWAEWLRSGFGPTPDPGYPLGPHGLAAPSPRSPASASASARRSSARSSRSACSPASPRSARCAIWAACAAPLGAALVALPYLAASYFAQAAFKETAEALLRARLRPLPARPRPPP